MTTINDLTKITNDVNGNPRYVIHFLQIPNLVSKGVSNQYDEAIKKARTIGGKKYHTKAYGGGIVFQSYNTQNLVNKINEL